MIYALTGKGKCDNSKFYMAEFYQMDAVRAEDVKLDRQGRTNSEIKALEAILTNVSELRL